MVIFHSYVSLPGRVCLCLPDMWVMLGEICGHLPCMEPQTLGEGLKRALESVSGMFGMYKLSRNMVHLESTSSCLVDSFLVV